MQAQEPALGPVVTPAARRAELAAIQSRQGQAGEPRQALDWLVGQRLRPIPGHYLQAVYPVVGPR